MDNTIVVHIHNRILFSHEEKWNFQKKMYESGEYCINLSNQDSERKDTTQTKDI